MRVGAQGLSLLSIPLNVHVLQALTSRSLSLADLRQAVGSPPQTTMRARLRALVDTGVLERRQQAGFPGSVDYQLTATGRRLVELEQTLQGWLNLAPNGPMKLGTPAAKSVVKALVDGWSCGLVRALAARPLSLTELSGVIPGLSYPSLERRLTAMRLAGQLEPRPGPGGKTLYLVSKWLRQSLAPLLLSALWEQQYCSRDTPPFRKMDIESTFLLGLPLVRSPEGLMGSCRLVVELAAGGKAPKLAGALVRVRAGKIESCVTLLEGEAGAWASGSAPAWTRAIVDHAADELEVGGDCDLALSLIGGLNSALFGPTSRNPARSKVTVLP